MMHSMASSEEGKGRALEQDLLLSVQVQCAKDIVEYVENDVMVSNIDYGGKGQAGVAGYTLQETRVEMTERKKLMSNSMREGPTSTRYEEMTLFVCMLRKCREEW